MKRKAARATSARLSAAGTGLLAFAALMPVTLTPAAVSAQTAQLGAQVADTWCQTCHDTGQGATGSDAAPSFHSIANRAEFDENKLRNWMMDPHPPMPNLSLSQTEIDALLAYLQSLRGK